MDCMGGWPSGRRLGVRGLGSGFKPLVKRGGAVHSLYKASTDGRASLKLGLRMILMQS